MPAGADSRRKRLAVRVGARKSAEVSALLIPTLVTKKVILAGVGLLPGGGVTPWVLY